MKTLKNILLQNSIFIFMFVSRFANADGITQLTSDFSTYKEELYILVGILGIIYLIVRGAMTFMNRIGWAAYMIDICLVGFVGACVALGGWAWSIHGSN